MCRSKDVCYTIFTVRVLRTIMFSASALTIRSERLRVYKMCTYKQLRTINKTFLAEAIAMDEETPFMRAFDLIRTVAST